MLPRRALQHSPSINLVSNRRKSAYRRLKYLDNRIAEHNLQESYCHSSSTKRSLMDMNPCFPSRKHEDHKFKENEHDYKIQQLSTIQVRCIASERMSHQATQLYPALKDMHIVNPEDGQWLLQYSSFQQRTVIGSVTYLGWIARPDWWQQYILRK
jgi:hypothetical protein